MSTGDSTVFYKIEKVLEIRSEKGYTEKKSTAQ